MPRPSRPRKRYVPKPAGRPIFATMHRDLIVPAYSALSALQLSTDADALCTARHTLASLLDVGYLALYKRGRETKPVADGLAALLAVIERHKRTGAWRASGPELESLRAAVRHIDDQLPTLQTSDIVSAVGVAVKEFAL